jgi:cytochrome c oxidase cbb3-type subunit 3
MINNIEIIDMKIKNHLLSIKKFIQAIVNKKFWLTFLFSLMALVSFSQPPATEIKAPAVFPQWAMDPTFYISLIIVSILLLTIYVLYRVNISLVKSIVPDMPETKVTAELKAAAEVKKIGAFQRIYHKLTDIVPVEHEKDVLLDHDYDGIKELDNNLPPWWKYGFYFTIAFAVFYLLYFHVSGIGKLQGDEYKEELAIAAQQKEARMKASADFVNEENVVALNDAENITKGKETFQKLCVACHRADAGGQVGPNLTDEFWLHGGGIKNVFKTITYGVPTKGMISWQSQLSPKQIQQVGSFVLSLKGSNPPNPKEPQGDVWIDESTAKLDSTKAVKDSAALAAPVASKK